MERESFEDEEVAEVLNKHFIPIKVDREERPDIDHIYMTVCQTLTGSGGWPLTIIMSPDKNPFFAGTYFPKQDKMGMPGLITILKRIIKVWEKDKGSLIESSIEITGAISKTQDISLEFNPQELIDKAYKDFKYSFDSVYGGFGSAPKFPTPHNLYFLLRYWYAYKEPFALQMVEKTLDSMHRGGIFDHISWGFSRYSTDRKWLIPHFEKMLYDNALLAIAYLETYQATKNKKYSEAAKQIFTYILRDMTSPEGGFYSAEDADSEGVEGKFYIWSPEEIINVLGERDGEWFCKYYDITEKGNFEGSSIPNLIKNDTDDIVYGSSFIENCRKKLFEYKEKRIHPYKDDKILTSWNGLMIAAMAIGGRVLGEKKYTEAAEKAVEFIFSNLVGNEDRLMARYRDGEAAYPAYADDYAYLIWGLTELYETTYTPDYLFHALRLNTYMLKYFWDDEKGGLFIYGNDSEHLITRPKEIYDGATPSGNSVATVNFLRLARLTGDNELEDLAEQQFKTFSGSIVRTPGAHSFMMTALLFAHSKSREVIVVSGTDRHIADEMLDIVREGFMPFTTSAFYSDEYEHLKRIMPFLESYKSVNGKATAYVCENFSCNSPVTDASEFKDMLQ